MNEKIKILHVLGTLNCGGAENLIMNIFRKMDCNQFQFDFVIHTDSECYFSREIEELGGNIFVAPRYKMINHLAYSKWWKSFLSQHSYHWIHGHMTSTAFIYLNIAQSYGMKTIAHSHNIASGTGVGMTLKTALEKRAGNHADVLMACSQNAGQWLFGEETPFQILNNGVCTEQYAFDPCVRTAQREKLGVSGNHVYGNVGRLNTQKNHDFLIDIFWEIKKKDPSGKLLLVGDGDLRQPIQEKIVKLGLDTDVIFTGIRSDVNELLMAMDVFIFPSLFEGLGIVLIEAQASGLRCFASHTVPREADVTGNVTYLGLDETANQWADSICACQPLDARHQWHAHVAQNGYDILETIQAVQAIYQL